MALVITSATVVLQDSSEPLTIAIDTNIEGNTDSEIGNIDTCAELAQVGDTLTFDLVVLNVSEDDLIAGYQVDIDYDPLVIQINDVIDVDAAGSVAPNNVTILSRIDSSRGFEFLHLSEVMPDQDGSLTVSAIDGTNDPLPPENHEAGEGVLARIIVEAVGSGVSDLTVPGPAGGFDGLPDKIINAGTGTLGRELDVRLLTGGRIAVGEPCVAPVTATVAPPSQTSTPGPGSEPTTPDGATLGPGETAPPNGTTGPGTGNGNGGPVGINGDSDGGSDTLLVIAVIAAVWVVAGGISAAWYILRRRSRGNTPPG